jgi:hypothetical protein
VRDGLFDVGLKVPAEVTRLWANVEGGNRPEVIGVFAGILVYEETSSIISLSRTRSMGQMLTVRKKARADRKTPRGKSEMLFQQILTKGVAGSYHEIGLKMDDRAVVQRRGEGGQMWE